MTIQKKSLKISKTVYDNIPIIFKYFMIYNMASGTRKHRKSTKPYLPCFPAS